MLNKIKMQAFSLSPEYAELSFTHLIDFMLKTNIYIYIYIYI